MIVRFLGSIYFAIALIVSTAVFVIIGTFLEAWSDSHLFAAHWIYNNPIFLGILWGYFINIFISTLLRYPFKLKHIPFIITHIGLLMLFGGALVKGHFGAQGVISLIEGTGTSKMLVPQTYALELQTRDAISVVALSPKKLGPLTLPTDDLQLSLIEWIPHVEPKLEGWIQGDNAQLFGFPPLAVHSWERGELPISLKTPDYTLSAIKSDLIDEIAKKLSNSAIVLARTSHHKTFLLAKNSIGELYQEELDDDQIVLFDHGYGGYGAIAELPNSFPSIDLMTPLAFKSERKQIPRKKEEATPEIRLLASNGKHSEIITLTYDRYAEGLSSPLFGNFLLRFQPKLVNIPSHIRLKEARQINYPDCEKPFSYESDLWIDGQEQTISMNKIHQTKQGYRFYMAGLSHRPYAKAAQIVVNNDPAKYILTYPGAVILTLGMLLLYLKKYYA